MKDVCSLYKGFWVIRTFIDDPAFYDVLYDAIDVLIEARNQLSVLWREVAKFSRVGDVDPAIVLWDSYLQ
ncbi:hypothetical protein PspS35_07870 [Pseudomonas sp. S35]|nr:hypothetical protein PspS35_07870 [Pseudomonas sp. S35]